MVLVIQIVICTLEVPRASCPAMLGMAHMWARVTKGYLRHAKADGESWGSEGLFKVSEQDGSSAGSRIYRGNSAAVAAPLLNFFNFLKPGFFL